MGAESIRDGRRHAACQEPRESRAPDHGLRSLSGFTVLELLVALAITTVVMAVAGSTFHLAAQMLERGAERAGRLLQVTQCLDILADDLSRQVRVTRGEGFVGQATLLGWWGVRPSRGRFAESRQVLERYRYAFDEAAQSILRVAEPEISWDEPRGPAERLADRLVADCVFLFPYRSDAGVAATGEAVPLTWMREWRSADRPPAAVRIHLEWWEDARQTRRTSLDRIIWLPQGTVGWL